MWKETRSKKKDWQMADKIRKTLLEKNISLEDTPSETKWRRIK